MMSVALQAASGKASRNRVRLWRLPVSISVNSPTTFQSPEEVLDGLLHHCVKRRMHGTPLGFVIQTREDER